MTDHAWPTDYLGDEMRALVGAILEEARLLPSGTNTCRLHEAASRTERTLLGRQGCVGCLSDPGNLDATDDREPLTIEDGWTRCPHCQAAVRILPLETGQFVAWGEDGRRHAHKPEYRVPFGQEARDARRGWSIETGRD